MATHGRIHNVYNFYLHLHLFTSVYIHMYTFISPPSAHISIYMYIYSRRPNYWRLVFFIKLYPYFTHKGLIFILEVKFQSFLAEPTHMPDLSSE